MENAKPSLKKIFVSICIIFIVVFISGCTDDDNPKTEVSKPIIRSIILAPKNIDYFDGLGNIISGHNTTSIVYDDGIYLSLSGDCMSSGRGIIVSNFSNSDSAKLSELTNSSYTINATLIVNFRTDEYYNSSTFIQWAMDDIFLNTTIQPKRAITEVIERSLLIENNSENNSDYDEVTPLRIKYFNPQGGFIPVPIDFDYIWIEIYYKI